MKKQETNIRIWSEDWKLLKELSRKEGRTLKGQFKAVVNEYYDTRTSIKNK